MSLPLPRGSLKASETIRFPLDVVFVPAENARPVVLLLKYAGRSNTAFVNAAAKAPAVSGAGSNAEQATASDLRLVPLYARHVVVGWENVSTEQGGEIVYTPDDCEELLRFLIVDEERPDIFRALAFVANDADRFVAKRVDAGAVGKR